MTPEIANASGAELVAKADLLRRADRHGGFAAPAR